LWTDGRYTDTHMDGGAYDVVRMYRWAYGH